MTVKRIGSGPGLPPGFPFSLASEENGILYISGMPALDADGKFVPGTFDEEADRAWANIAAIAAAGGCSPADFLYVQVVPATSVTTAASTSGGAGSSPTRPRHQRG
jgi:2-iminobutanoate/2-iminopropanoate deaminase